MAQKAPSARSKDSPGKDLSREESARQLGPDNLRKMYHAMLRIRLLDTRMMNLQRQGRIGFYGTATGEEAAVVGSAFALEERDWIFPALRQSGAALLRGLPMRELVAQLFGNSADSLKGKQMPCHASSKAIHHVSWSSCVGTQLPQAVGAAMAARIRKEAMVVMAYMGDGASSTADFHVALNFAGIYRAPVVFLCQNNQFAISVPFRLQTAAESIAVKAVAYGIEGIRIDGNDLLEVYEKSKAAVLRARSGKGATLIEALTYRMGGHSSSDDPGRYRDKSEVDEWAARDPIERFRKFLESMALWDQDFQRRSEQEILAEIEKAIQEVQGAPTPSLETLFEDVYGEMPKHLKEQKEDLVRSWKEKDGR